MMSPARYYALVILDDNIDASIVSESMSQGRVLKAGAGFSAHQDDFILFKMSADVAQRRWTSPPFDLVLVRRDELLGYVYPSLQVLDKLPDETSVQDIPINGGDDEE